MTCPLGGGRSIQLSYGGYMRDGVHYKPLTERDKPMAPVHCRLERSGRER